MLGLAKLQRSVFGWIVMAAIFSLALVGCHKTQPVAGTNPPAQSSPAVERPRLIARIDTVSIYPVPGHAQDSAVSLMVSVGNTGFPSTVQGWRLGASSLGQTFTAEGPVHINGVVDAPAKLGTKIDLDKEDLAVKTARDPVARDSYVHGVLIYI